MVAPPRWISNGIRMRRNWQSGKKKDVRAVCERNARYSWKEESWRCLRTGDLKVETEALICAAKEKALRTNNVKYHVKSPLCRLCGERTESVSHIATECTKLSQKEYKRRHEKIWAVCKNMNWRVTTNGMSMHHFVVWRITRSNYCGTPMYNVIML